MLSTDSLDLVIVSKVLSVSDSAITEKNCIFVVGAVGFVVESVSECIVDRVTDNTNDYLFCSRFQTTTVSESRRQQNIHQVLVIGAL